ncbi:MAG: hypothetical protein JO266_05510 [Acidobacteria bacterium]|nr:hypothetical protein [Acidobacteriota bacterium]
MRPIDGLAAVTALFALTIMAPVQEKAPPPSPAGGVDKSDLQRIWDGWSTLNPSNVARYYARGSHVFFDIAPVKYDSWDDYQAGVIKVLSGFQSATCKVNDDVQIHKAGKDIWITATIAADMVEKSGKHDMSTFRWTAI